MTDIYEVNNIEFLEKIKSEAQQAVCELCEVAKLKKGSLFVVGCSSSEVLGEKIGTNSSLDVAHALLSGICCELKKREIHLAVQCCEHLNRAVILEGAVAQSRGYEVVNVVPQPKAGGSLGALAYMRLEDAVAVEKIAADAGIDIGLTMIGMHLKSVAVPVRLSINKIGNAPIVCARTRPKFIGGVRACYDESKL